MVPAVLLSALSLLGTTGNGLECTFTNRCVSGICMETEAAPLRVLFVHTPASRAPVTFVLGHKKLFDGLEITAREERAMSRVFGDFSFKPDTYAYAVGAFNAYDPAVGRVGLEVGGRQLDVAADGTANFDTLREGRPGMDWLTRFTGHCSARTF